MPVNASQLSKSERYVALLCYLLLGLCVIVSDSSTIIIGFISFSIIKTLDSLNTDYVGRCFQKTAKNCKVSFSFDQLKTIS